MVKNLRLFKNSSLARRALKMTNVSEKWNSIGTRIIIPPLINISERLLNWSPEDSLSSIPKWRNEIIRKIKKIDKNFIKKVTIFDVFEGDKLPDNKKSIAIRVLMQPQDKTFSDQEIENLSKQIIDVISKSFEASIRN